MKRFEQYYLRSKGNKWYRYFAVFCRVALALGFIPSGIVKVMGQRFTALPSNHPLGHYFDALHQTGYYYNFIGVAQLLAALLLLIPATAVIGTLIYLPAILNICVLAYATRFEGTRITTMMLLANLYLLFWYYDRIRLLLPGKQSGIPANAMNPQIKNNRFPAAFFAGVVAVVAVVIIANIYLFEIRPGNSVIECRNGAIGSAYPKASAKFCDCIYDRGRPLKECLEEFEQAKLVEKKE